MSDMAPACAECGRMLDRINHIGTERFILDEGVYRILGVHDGSADGTTFGMASEVELLCGYCGHPVRREDRQFFYERWEQLLAYTKRLTEGSS